jgi:hypothetical protein
MKTCPLAVALLLLGTGANAAPPKDFAARVERARSAVGVPGVAVAIVEGENVTLAQRRG